MIPYLPDELQLVVMNIKDPGKVTDLIASNLNISLEEKQDLLSTLSVRSRLQRLSVILNREIELLELGSKIQSQVQTEAVEEPARILSATADARDPARARRGRQSLGGARGAAPPPRRGEAARGPPARRADTELDRLRIIPPESAEHSVRADLPRSGWPIFRGRSRPRTTST